MQFVSNSLHYVRMLESVDLLKAGALGLSRRRSERRISGTVPWRTSELVALHTIQGRMRCLVEGRILTIGRHALLWVHRNQARIVLSESPDFDAWVLIFSPNILTPAHLFPPLDEDATQHAPEARLIGPEFSEELYRLAESIRNEKDAERLKVALRWWATRAWEIWRLSQTVAGNQVHPAVRRAADCLRKFPNLSLSEVADQAGLSRTHLSRTFHADTGIAISEYRNRRRLELVDAALAANRPPTLLTAALDAGFGSYPQFFRVFRKARGVNPRNYYKQ